MALFKNRIPKHPVGQIAMIQDQNLGIIDLGRDMSRALREQIDKNILTHGEPFKSGGVLGPASLPVLGAGAAVTSSLFAGNIFLATANPATLMTIKGGFSSAVIGSGGKIVAHAPFMAASSAIIPVVAPVMFFMTVSSMMMSARFDQVQFSLDRLADAVGELLQRELAEDYGILFSAMERLRDITCEFQECLRFTEEMKIRLALVERDVSSLHHKYHSISIRDITSVTSAGLTPSDQHLFMLSRLADVYVDKLRLKLALQDNPDDVTRSFSALNDKLDRYEKEFRELLSADSVRAYQKQLESSVEGMGWWKRNVFARGDKGKKEQEIDSLKEIRTKQLGLARLNIARWSADFASGRDAGHEQSVVYYRDRDSKGDLKAYYTSDLRFEPQEKAN